MAKPFIVTLLAVYGVILPYMTKAFIDESHSDCYEYAYWAVIIATPLLPITCLLGFVHIGICIGFYVKQKSNPEEEFHGLFIAGTIPMITIVVFAVSAIWQAILKGINSSIGSSHSLHSLKDSKLLLFYVCYVISSTLMGAFFIVYAGEEYLWGLYILPIKASILYWLWKFFSYVDEDPYCWKLGREFFFLVITYLVASLPCLIIFYVNPEEMTSITRNIIFVVGVIGVSCLLGIFACLICVGISFIFYEHSCVKFWVTSVIFYFAFGLLLNYGFTSGIQHEGYQYGYYAIVLMLALHMLPLLYHRERNIIGGLNAFMQTNAPLLFISFWVWTKAYGNYDAFSHFLYVMGILNFTSLLSYLLSILWNAILLNLLGRININLELHITKISGYISAILFLAISSLIQLLVILFLQNSQYYYGLAIIPLIPLILTLLFTIKQKGISNAMDIEFDDGFIVHYFTFILIFGSFFIVFCIKQAYNPEETFHLEFVLGIILWIPTLLGLVFFMSLRQHFFKRFLIILSVATMILTICYIFISRYNDDSKESSNILYASVFFIFLPGMIYFLICAIKPSGSNRYDYDFNFGSKMKKQIYGSFKAFWYEKWCCHDCPLGSILTYSLLMPLYFISVLIQYIFLFIWCFFFQTIKLFIIPPLASAHIPFASNSKQERINININLGIFLEGAAFSLPQIILLSIHRWAVTSDKSPISITFYFLFLLFALISLSHALLNGILNIRHSKIFCGLKSNPFLLRIFPRVIRDRERNDQNYRDDVSFMTLVMQNIPIIQTHAQLPLFPIDQHRVVATSEYSSVFGSIAEEEKKEENIESEGSEGKPKTLLPLSQNDSITISKKIKNIDDGI